MKTIALNEDIYLSKRKNKLTENIIEESGDGYIKFGNGIMICYDTVSMGTLTFTTDYWATFNRSDKENMRITYPQKFEALPICTLNSVGSGIIIIVNSQGTATQSPGFTLITPKNYTSNREVVINYIAIGKWK